MSRRTTSADASTLLRLIDSIYAAATDAALWPQLIETLVKTTDSEMGYITVYDVAEERELMGTRFGGDPDLLAEYAEHWQGENIYMKELGPRQTPGEVLPGEAIVPDEIVTKTAFYNELLVRIGVMHHTGVCLFHDATMRAFLLLDRKIGRPTHSWEHLRLLQALAPHLQRATAIQTKLRGLELERSASQEGLNRLSVGVFVLGRSGVVRWSNTAAQKIVAAKDGLELQRGGVVATHTGTAQELRRLISGACNANTIGPDCGGWLKVPRPSGRRAYATLVTPLRFPHREFGVDNAPRALLFVGDPDRSLSQRAPAAVLAQLFGLTPAEARMAAAIAALQSLEEYADDAGVTIGTARWTLKRVLEKTQCRRQSELVQLIATTAAAWTPE